MKKLAGNPYINQNNSDLLLDRVNMNSILAKFKTPIMVFLENRIRENIKTFKETISSQFEQTECFFSLKANFLPEILKIINSEGIGVEVISLPELKIALKEGVSPDNIIVGGPYLPKALIKLSIEKDIKEIIVYNFRDLYRINQIAKDHQKIQDICIRINSNKFNSKLGTNLEEDTLESLKEILENCSHLHLSTLLSHYGSQMNNAHLFKRNLNILIEVLLEMKKYNINISKINMGGGFPEATVMPRDQLLTIMKELKIQIERVGLTSLVIAFEPGRYFIGDSGVFITKIIAKKPGRWIFLNIGNHICPKFARCPLRFYNASRIDSSHKFKTSIAGIIPSDQDVLVKDYFFTKDILEGDKVIVANVGAYCLTFSTRFPYALPKILLIHGDSYDCIFDPNQDHDFSLF
ncbi:MAG: hypothetical protein EU533_08075 [Promethearchaeota archaeon]|nr:MAG: hypothetical protein EU533_08075 [Candidatus Lokiarchaeota archaeon]